MEKMMDPNLVDYNLIDCAIHLKIAMENRYQIDFGNPADVNGLVMLQYILINSSPISRLINY